MSGDRIRVVVADDHPLFCESLACAVKHHPKLALVGQAHDGLTALELIREEQPDVAVIDLRMPGLEGIPLAATLSAEGSDTRVLLLSGLLDEEDVYTALEAGVCGVLQKTIRAVQIVDSVLAVARGETVLAPELHGSIAAVIRRRRAEDRRSLTEREREILGCVAQGMSNAEIASRLYLSSSTIKSHLEKLYGKLGASDRGSAVAVGFREGLLH